MKIDSGFLPTGKWMTRFDKWDDTRCPICDKVEETIDHFFGVKTKERRIIG